MTVSNSDSPRLLSSYKGFNLLVLGVKYCAVPQKLGPVDPLAEREDSSELIWAEHEAALRQKIDASGRVGSIQLVSSYRGFNLLAAGDEYCAVPQKLGAGTTVIERQHDHPELIWAEDEGALRRKIDSQRLWRRLDPVQSDTPLNIFGLPEVLEIEPSCQVDSGFKNYAIYPISILCLCALLIAHATLLSQFASPRASPAVLITVEKEHQFNIVKFDGRFFGVPFGVPISWGAPSYDSDSRLIIAASQDEVKSRIRDQGIRQVQTPILTFVDKEHQFNIVKFDGRFFGVPFGVPITWGAPRYDSDSRLIIAASQDEVESRIRDQGTRQGQTPILTFVDKEHQFNIVKFDGRFFGVPFGVPITWGAPGYDADPRLIIAVTQGEAASRIISRQAEKEMASRPKR